MSHILSTTPALRLEAISMQLRESDVAEVVAAHGKSPKEVLTESIDISSSCFVMIHEGKVEGVFGISEHYGWGIPWMLATDKLHQFHLKFLRVSRIVVAVWLQEYPSLTNYVDSRHTEAIKWLKWLGFTIHETPTKLHDPAVDFFPFTLHRGEQR